VMVHGPYKHRSGVTTQEPADRTLFSWSFSL
jgi:hypothetical protein